MGIYDRDYSHDQQRPQVRFTMPHITPVVKWLLIINAGVFLFTAVQSPLSNLISKWFSVFPYSMPAIFLQPLNGADMTGFFSKVLVKSRYTFSYEKGKQNCGMP